MYLGIDFGSTYSTAAKYNEKDDQPEAINTGEGSSASVPSLVSISSSGNKAYAETVLRQRMNNRGLKIYDAFKMLLIESDEQMLSSLNYTTEITPKVVSGYFLDYLLNAVMERCSTQNDDKIDRLCICVPENWCSSSNSDSKTLDGRGTLKDILTHDVLKDYGDRFNRDVQIVTEPEAASAYFAHNYEKESGNALNGYLLLIDYGGGTLDVTLTKITSTGNGKMDIRYCGGCGVGQNHPDKGGENIIGNAGIAYMQRITKIAIADYYEREGITEPINFASGDFRTAVRELEGMIRDANNIKVLRAVFNGDFRNFKKIMNKPDKANKSFCTFWYGDEEITVTYKHIYSAYKTEIEDVLESTLCEIDKYVEKCIGCDPTSPASANIDNFKIALVGGFGTFHLVRQQVYEHYNINPAALNDKRIKFINANKSEQAIALGASLIASNRVNLIKVARFSIGIITTDSEKKGLAFAIRYHDIIEPDVPHFLHYKDSPDERIQYGPIRGHIKEFAISHQDTMNSCRPLVLKKEMMDKIDVLDDHCVWYLGFSIDNNGVISLHAENVYDSKEYHKITLESYSQLFELTHTREVIIDEI